MTTNPDIMRRKAFIVEVIFLKGLLSRGIQDHEWIRVPEPLNLPMSARICGMYYRPESHALMMIAEDSSFPPVPSGAEIPMESMRFSDVRIIKGDAQKRIDELEDTLADLYHHHDLTSRAMQRIHEVLPQGDGPGH